MKTRVHFVDYQELKKKVTKRDKPTFFLLE